jgi:ABC-type sugar transport system substrate-binding protein
MLIMIKITKPLAAVAAALSCAAVSIPASASQQSGQISKVALFSTTTSNGIWVSGETRSVRPACATDDMWAIPSPGSDSGKAMLSGLLDAFKSGKMVDVYGAGTCDTTQPNREAIVYVIIH